MKRVILEDFNKHQRLVFKVTLLKPFCVLLSLFRIDDCITHQSRFVDPLFIPSLLASCMEATIPGIECR